MFTKDDLNRIICDTLDISQITPMIKKQIFKYVSELGLTYKEIAQALVFYIEERGGEYQAQYGIGIVPHVVDDAKAYFARLKRQKEQQERSVKEANKQPNIILKAKKVKKRRKMPKINIDEIDVD